MDCRYENKTPARFNYVATLGVSTTVFEGFPMSDYPMESGFYTKDEIEHADLEVLESIKVEDKYKAFQEYVQMLIRWGWKVEEAARMPHTHDERARIASNLLGDLRGVPLVYSAEIVGSVKNGSDKLLSDIDVKILTSSCPGEGACRIAQIMEKYRMEPIDVFCSLMGKPEL